MGSKQSNSTTFNSKNREELNRNQFDFLYVVGKGGFGKVWKVNHKKTKKLFALKEMSKPKIIDKKSEKSIKYEKELLCRLKHPFIVNMQYAFQDFENLYLVMDLLTGGDLRYHISRHKKFSEEQTRFFVACLLLGLEYIHNNNVIHRDIKPENLVLDERGYVRITDFGIAKVYQKENSSETSGTPGYMSPEVMCAQNHTIAVDYFAVGVIAYEFMHGRRPYVGKSRKEIKEQIMAKQVQIKLDEIPDGWSQDAADLINKRKPGLRLGLRGAAEVKDHPWLKYYPWKELYEKRLEAPFIPKLGDNFDKKYCEGPDKIGDTTKERYEKYVREDNFQIAFKNFTVFNNNEESNGINNNNNNKNQSAKNRAKDSKENNSNSGSSNTKTRPMHMRSSSVSVPSSALLNHNNLNSNYNNASYINKESLNYNNNYNNNNNNNNGSNNLNSTILKSKVKIIDRDLRSSSNLSGNAIGLNASNTLRSGIGAYHKQAQSYNSSLYGNLMQSNSNFAAGSAKVLDKSADKRSTPLLQDSSKSIKMPTSRLPNINSIDKLKLKKLVNSSSSNLLFKYYKQSANSNNSTGASLTNQIFGKKSALAASQQFSNMNHQ